MVQVALGARLDVRALLMGMLDFVAEHGRGVGRADFAQPFGSLAGYVPVLVCLIY